MNNMMEEITVPIIFRKIEPNKKYKVFKSVFNDNTYYKIRVRQANVDGNKNAFYIRLVFKKGVEIPNESEIIIKKAIENFKENPKDKYNPILYYTVLDFEMTPNQERVELNEVKKFGNNLSIKENEKPDDYDYDIPF